MHAKTTSAAVTAGYESTEVWYTYDYLGRRVLKRVLKGAVNTYTRYAYDGWNVIAEINGNAFAAATGADRTFAWGLDVVGSLDASGGVGALLQIVDLDPTDGGEFLPAYDGNGNVAALYDADTGAEEAVYEYSPFGEPLRATGDYADANPFRFSTKFADDETGLVYYGHRYYSTALGRFINRDPLEESGGLNLYGFVGNDPVNGWDYLGMADDDVVIMDPYEAWAGNDDPYLGHNEYKLGPRYDGLLHSAETAEANRRLQEALNRLLELNQELKNVVESHNRRKGIEASLRGEFQEASEAKTGSEIPIIFNGKIIGKITVDKYEEISETSIYWLPGVGNPQVRGANLRLTPEITDPAGTDSVYRWRQRATIVDQNGVPQIYGQVGIDPRVYDNELDIMDSERAKGIEWYRSQAWEEDIANSTSSNYVTFFDEPQRPVNGPYSVINSGTTELVTTFRTELVRVPDVTSKSGGETVAAVNWGFTINADGSVTLHKLRVGP